MQGLGVDLRFINYENLVKDQFSEYSKVFSPIELVSLGEFSIVEESSLNSLSKYKEVLTDKQISEVLELVKLSGL
jgi:cadmium resistance protein CadD (predicted permease)